MITSEDTVQLLAAYGRMIDHDALEAWLELFVEDAIYRVVPRENWDRGLPLALIDCVGRNMIQDRIVALRQANEFNLHVSRHMLGLPHIVETTGDTTIVETNFTVFQSDMEGRAQLFCLGHYRDTVVRTDAGLKFQEKLVIVDNFNITSLLARPI